MKTLVFVDGTSFSTDLATFRAVFVADPMFFTDLATFQAVFVAGTLPVVASRKKIGNDMSC